MEVVAPLALDAVADAVVAAGGVAVVAAAVGKAQDAIAVSLEGKPVASRLFVVLPHTVAELAVGEDAVAVVEVRSLDIVAQVLAEEHPEVGLASEDLACAVEDRVVGAVEEVDHYEDCR